MLLDHHDVNVSLPWAKLLYKDEDKCKSKFIQTKIRLDDYCHTVFLFQLMSHAEITTRMIHNIVQN